MAKRRMLSLDVVDTDVFLDLPASSQSLYFHLGMRADDDGFVSSPKRITAMVNASGDDLKLLIAKGFIIPFEAGVCVIRDWKVNNYIQSDRYAPSIYIEEKQHLSCEKNGRYSYSDTPCIQNVSKADTQDRREKGRGRKSNGVDPQGFIDFYEAKGWMVGKTPMRDWQAACRNAEKWDRWEHDAKQSNPEQPAPQFDPATETWRR